MDLPPPLINQRRHQPRRAGLVACTQTGTVVAVKVFMKQEAIAPVGIFLEFGGIAVDRSASVGDSGRSDEVGGRSTTNSGP